MLDPNVNRSCLKPKTILFTTTVACLCLLSLASVRAPAQDIAGLYTGLVVDSNGAAITNATVELTSSKTHESKMTATSATGSYQFSGLSSGEYDLRVERPPALYERLHHYNPPQRKPPAFKAVVILAAVIDKLGAPISLRVQNIDIDPEL